MASVDVEQPVEQVEIMARVIRADGTDEGERCLAYWHRRWWRRLWARYGRGIKGVVNKRPTVCPDGSVDLAAR